TSWPRCRSSGFTHLLLAPNRQLTQPGNDPSVFHFPSTRRFSKMRRRIAYVVLAALIVLVGSTTSTLAAQRDQLTYLFNGRLLADAGSSSSLYVDVNGGSKPALKKLV